MFETHLRQCGAILQLPQAVSLGAHLKQCGPHMHTLEMLFPTFVIFSLRCFDILFSKPHKQHGQSQSPASLAKASMPHKSEQASLRLLAVIRAPIAGLDIF